MKAILVNYNFTPDWLKDEKLDVIMYDRSDDGIERDLTQYGAVYKTKNMGDVDCDKLSYLIENYDNLPDVFLWSKSNLFKFITKEEWDLKKNNKTFTPLLTKNHKTYLDKFGEVCKYQGELYAERADSWFFNAGLDSSGRFRNWQDWANYFHLPQVGYIPFAPGGSYILTRETVQKHSKDLYEEMRNMLPYAMHPLEAHCCERSYYLLWR